MAALTKLALTQANTALANDNAALRAQVAGLTLDLEIVRAQLVNVTEVASAVNKMPAKPARPAYVMPQWQKDRLAAMEAAKEEAKATHRAVRV